MERDTYRIVYRLVGAINVKADSPKDAREQFEGFPDELLHQHVDSAYVSDVFKTDKEVTKLV